MTAHLPGGEILEAGLRDVRAGRLSVEALAVLIGRSRLTASGIDVPAAPSALAGSPEHALYALLAIKHGNEAHSRYNAIIRRLVKLERALEWAR